MSLIQNRNSPVSNLPLPSLPIPPIHFLPFLLLLFLLTRYPAKPLVYCANGSHANYATPGVHDHTFPNLNLDFPFLLVDHTDEGPLWDPTLSAYYVSYDPTKNSFTPYDSATPIGWLNYVGRWGDQQYPDKDKRQKQLAGNRKFVGGPTGPQDKQLNRKNVCPVNGQPCILRDHLEP